jgi:phosphoribosylglycinamide formyltransferase-1
MIRIAIFASGSGTNAEALINHFSGNSNIQIAKVLSNKESAGVLGRADRLGISKGTFSKSELQDDSFLTVLKNDKIDFIVLAGFLLKIPPYLIKAFPEKIVNIHPALLPKYGGKGMYGHYVHEAVIENGENESGITIHLVDEIYDNGRHLFQAKVPVDSSDTPGTLASKIHELEHAHFPTIVENYIKESFI